MKVIATLGDYYHDEQRLKDCLEEVLQGLNDVELAYVDRQHLIEVIMGDQPDLVILGAENRLNPQEDPVDSWLTEEDAQVLADFVGNGGSFLAWHSGLASYDKITTFVNMLGGYFLYHPAAHQIVTYRYQNHFLFDRQRDNFKIKDEHYFMKYQEDIDIFLRSDSVDGESIAGWTRNHGEGRVACYAPAHLVEGLEHQLVKEDLDQLIQWCLGLK